MTRGPDKSTTAAEVRSLMASSNRPVWTSKDVADHFSVSRPTATARLKELLEDGEVDSIDVGNTTAYYLPRAVGEYSIEEEHKQSLVREFTDRFVGLQSAPWTAIHPKDGAAVGGDKIQIEIEGVPGNWSYQVAYHWEDRRIELEDDEIIASETQALISGELYTKPTVPIRHIEYPDDYDLEDKIGAKIIETERGVATIAYGEKSHLIRPENEAVFLRDVSVDWISEVGAGDDMPVRGVEGPEDAW